MKGVVPDCIAQLVKEKFGSKKWEDILKESGMSPYTVFLPIHDIQDSEVFKIISSLKKVVGISNEELEVVFGDYWVNSYAVNMYSTYFKNCKSAKELLLKMDSIHEIMTKSMPNATPPRFSYTWKDDKTLIMEYSSPRNMIDFLPGLVKGVARHYGETINVRKLDHSKIEVVW